MSNWDPVRKTHRKEGGSSDHQKSWEKSRGFSPDVSQAKKDKLYKSRQNADDIKALRALESKKQKAGDSFHSPTQDKIVALRKRLEANGASRTAIYGKPMKVDKNYGKIRNMDKPGFRGLGAVEGTKRRRK